MELTVNQLVVSAGVYILLCMILIYLIVGRLRKLMMEVNAMMQTSKDLVTVNRNKSERLDKMLAKARQRGFH